MLKKILHSIPLVIASAALFCAIALCFVNVVTRYFFSFTYNGLDAAITLCFAYTVFVGSAAAYKLKMHYGVDSFVATLSAQNRAAAQVLLDILLLVIMLCGTYLSVVLSVKAMGKTVEGLNIPYFWYDLSAVIGFLYCTVYSAEFLAEDIRDAKKVGKGGEGV